MTTLLMLPKIIPNTKNLFLLGHYNKQEIRYGVWGGFDDWLSHKIDKPSKYIYIYKDNGTFEIINMFDRMLGIPSNKLLEIMGYAKQPLLPYNMYYFCKCFDKWGVPIFKGDVISINDNLKYKVKFNPSTKITFRKMEDDPEEEYLSKLYSNNENLTLKQFLSKHNQKSIEILYNGCIKNIENEDEYIWE